jgi:hypothetical protein
LQPQRSPLWRGIGVLHDHHHDEVIHSRSSITTAKAALLIY